MTLTYNRTNKELTITSTHITTYLGDTNRYNIDIQLNDVSKTTVPTVNPYVATGITADIVYEVKIILVDTNIPTSTTIELGCIWAEGDVSSACTGLRSNVITFAHNNKNIDSTRSNKAVLSLYLLEQANQCPCKCDEIKDIKAVLDTLIETCDDC